MIEQESDEDGSGDNDSDASEKIDQKSGSSLVSE